MTALVPFVMVVVLGLCTARSAYADSAVVLPKGYGFLNLEDRYFLPTTQRYDQNGNTVSIGSDFSQNLTSNIFPGLAAFDPFVPGGTASIGSSVVEIKRYVNVFRPLLAYGVTDRLTAGVIIPYYWTKNQVNASINPATANVGKSPFAVGPGNPLGLVPFAFGVPSTTPLNINDVQQLLAAQGLKPVQTTETEGFGDIEFGARYQYYRSESFRAAFTGIVIAPTGKMDDIDNLVDIPTGDGNWAIRFQFQQDFMKQKEGLSKRLGFPEVGDYFINTTFEYLYNLPDNRTVRVCSPLLPVCSQKADVTRKTGDIVQAEIQGNLGVLTDGLILIGGYNYLQQFKAHFTGDQPGLPYGDLSIGSNVTAHEFFVGMTFSTVPLVVKRKFPMPIVANVQYRERFAGENAFKTQALWFTIATYFDVNALIGLNSR